MSSPFPGMDPYIESQGYWEDFHSAFLGDCRRALTAVLPRHYGAFIEQCISLVDLSDDLDSSLPDPLSPVHRVGLDLRKETASDRLR
jgi:Protein of unknown function (DUF4058)